MTTIIPVTFTPDEPQPPRPAAAMPIPDDKPYVPRRRYPMHWVDGKHCVRGYDEQGWVRTVFDFGATMRENYEAMMAKRNSRSVA